MNPTPQQLACAEGMSRRVINGLTTQQQATADLVQRYGLSQQEAVALYIRGDAQRAGRTGQVPGPRTLLSQDRAEVAALLLGHGLDEDTVTELLDAAGLHGDGQCAAARVSFDEKSGTWLADLFGGKAGAA